MCLPLMSFEYIMNTLALKYRVHIGHRMCCPPQIVEAWGGPFSYIYNLRGRLAAAVAAARASAALATARSSSCSSQSGSVSGLRTLLGLPIATMLPPGVTNIALNSGGGVPATVDRVVVVTRFLSLLLDEFHLRKLMAASIYWKGIHGDLARHRAPPPFPSTGIRGNSIGNPCRAL